jgi:hypothetical protein
MRGLFLRCGYPESKWRIWNFLAVSDGKLKFCRLSRKVMVRTSSVEVRTIFDNLATSRYLLAPGKTGPWQLALSQSQNQNRSLG